jgi:pre-mRNA-splicing helicase BRR2
VTDILQIMGNASRPELDQSGKCFILCHGPKKEYYKKFLYEPIPVESHLDHALHDHLNAEVVAKSIESQSEAMDWITYSFFYLRLRQNPNYYNMQGRSNMHVSDHLSELIETVLGDLEESKCVAVEGDGVVSPLNLGMLASYYYVLYTTIELFANSLKRKHRLRPIMELLSSASEFDDLAVRRKESGELQLMSNHMPHKLEKPAFNDPHVKTNLLLQAHLSRVALKEDLAKDQMVIVQKALPLLYAMVDVIAANSWLKVALSCMELCQGIVQGLWATDSQLLQLPHISKQCAQRCKDAGVNSIFDLLDLDDEPRNRLLGLNEAQMTDIAGVSACERESGSVLRMGCCVGCRFVANLMHLQPWPIATPPST